LPFGGGIHYHAIRGKKDFDYIEFFERFNGRSKYGIKYYLLTGRLVNTNLKGK